MAVPHQFTDEAAHSRLAACTDVSEIETEFAALATGLTDPWTDSGGGVYVSPVDADGRWFDLTFDRKSATNMDVLMRTAAGTTVCQGRFQKPATNDPVDIFVGNHYYDIEAWTAAGSSERAEGGIPDLYPESQTYFSQHYYCFTQRTTLDAARTRLERGYVFAWDGAAYTQDNSWWGMPEGRNTTYDTFLSSATGLPLFFHVYFAVESAYAGRIYNYMWCPQELTPWATFSVPVDNGVNYNFVVVPRGTYSGGNYRAMIRVP